MSIVPVPTDSKPVCDLAKHMLDKLHAVCGVMYEPRRIRKKADADAYATRVATQAEIDCMLEKAQSQVELSELQKAAVRRVAFQAAREQENIEAIAEKAIGMLDDDDMPGQAPSDDWVANFFDNSKHTSDDNIQNLWAKILAGEFKNPGSYSRHTVQILRSLEPEDANNFNNLARYACQFGSSAVPLIYQPNDPIYNLLTISALTNLAALGLVSMIQGASITFQDPYFSYQGVGYSVVSGDDTIPIGTVMLTNAGNQLVNICHLTPIDGFMDYVIHLLRGRSIYVMPREKDTTE